MSTDESPTPPNLSTVAIHAGTRERQAEGSVTVPIFRTSTYTFTDTDELKRHFGGNPHRMEYGRYGNPTQAACEAKLAALDGAEAALVTSSGMAAITTTMIALLRGGHHVILVGDCYRRTRQFCNTVLSKFGVETTHVPTLDLAAIEEAITPKTRLIVTESPTNPFLNTVDVSALRDLKRGRYFKILIDATFATPINMQPLLQGADLVVHSATKYLGGHNDLMAGVVAGSRPLIDAIREMHGILGAIVDPQAAYLLIRGLKTLPLRVTRQNDTAACLAEFLEARPEVETVYYPGLPSHQTHATAKSTMSGYGGVVSFVLRTDVDGASRFVDACRIFAIGPSLGGVESLIEQVALMSYFELTTQERLALGIRDSLIRMSVGLEAVEDLQADLVGALARI